MSKEIRTEYTTGQTLYAIIRNLAGQTWNVAGEQFETYVPGSVGDYALALTETPSDSYMYEADFPSAPSGVHDVIVYVQDGISPALTDGRLRRGVIEWDGTAEADPMVGIAADRIVAGKTTYDASTGVLTVYADDGVTVLRTVTITGQANKTSA